MSAFDQILEIYRQGTANRAFLIKTAKDMFAFIADALGIPPHVRRELQIAAPPGWDRLSEYYAISPDGDLLSGVEVTLDKGDAVRTPARLTLLLTITRNSDGIFARLGNGKAHNIRSSEGKAALLKEAEEDLRFQTFRITHFDGLLMNVE